MASKDTDRRVVYSTGAGRIDKPVAGQGPPAGDGIVRIQRESKGRKGKGVSVISGLGLDAAALKSLARELKKHCGVGGAVKQWDIELQTDQRERIKAALEQRGFRVKLAGG